MKLDMKKLKTDINATANKLKFLRSNNYNSMMDNKVKESYDAYVKTPGPTTRANYCKIREEAYRCSRSELKRLFTMLCSVRADHRNRLHQVKIRNPYSNKKGEPRYVFLSKEDQVSIITPLLREYLQEDNK